MATNRYSRAKVYKLVNSCDDEIYVGSTCEPLHKRLYKHKQKAKLTPERRVYQHLLDIGFDNVSIILIENFACESKEELLQRERYWIDELQPSLNKVLPTRTRQQWFHDNAEKVREYQEKYRLEHAEIARERSAKWYEENRERAAKYRADNADEIRERRKQRYAENKEKQRERCAKWRAENPEKYQESKAKSRAKKKAEQLGGS